MTPTAAQAEAASHVDPIAEAIFRNGESTTGISLEVDVKGRVSSCEVTESSGSRELDAKACDVFKDKAKFKPWRGPERDKIRTLKTRVVWRIEG